MTSEHLSDEEIQEYVLNQQNNAHVQTCALCKAKAEAYQLLITAIEQEPAPVLDFDISEMVLASIETQQQKSKNGWIYVLVLVGALVTSAAVYFFWKDIAILFRGISTFMVYLLAFTALLLLIALVADQFKNYKNKMQQIKGQLVS